MIEDFNLGEIDFDFDLGDFELDAETEETEDAPQQFARVKKFKRPRVCKYEYAEKLASDIGDIKDGESVFCIVSGNFIAGDFIEAYLKVNNLTCDEIIVSVLSLSQENVDSLKNIFLQGRCKKMGLLISDYFFAHERRKDGGVPYIIDEMKDYDFSMAAAGIHTKIVLIKTTCGKNIVISGSANLRSSRNIEQVTIDNCNILYEFNRAWICDIIDTYQVTHKSLRAGKLWQKVTAQAEKVD